MGDVSAWTFKFCHETAIAVEFPIPLLRGFGKAGKSLIFTLVVLSGLQRAEHNKSGEERDFESLMPVAVRLGNLQQMWGRRVGRPITCALVAKTVPEKRFRSLVVPSFRKFEKQSWDIPIAMRVVEFLPKRIIQRKHQKDSVEMVTQREHHTHKR